MQYSNSKVFGLAIVCLFFCIESILAQTSFTAATLKDDGGYVLLHGQNEAKWQNVPTKLSEKILELNKAGKYIKSVAITSTGGYVLLWDKNEASWLDVPKALSDKILELNKNGNTLKSVALRDDGGYVLLWDRNQAYWNGVPTELSDKILELNKQNQELKHVAINDHGGYVLLWNQNQASWSGVPKGLSNKIIELNKAGETLKSVALRDDGAYLLMWGMDSYWMDLLPSALVKNLKELSTAPPSIPENPTKADNTAPEIIITEPVAARGLMVEDDEEYITIKGRATDESGIKNVTINNQDIGGIINGQIVYSLKMGIGKNPVTIKATDMNNNVGTYSFIINRTEPKTITPTIEPKALEKRIALVIGNANYGAGKGLKNPANDAELMSSTLKDLGFEVIKLTNADKPSMEKGIREFSKKLQFFEVALFYYAGHGVQVDGQNYLLPTDAVLADKTDCKFEAIPVNFIVEEFERFPNNTNIVILDACRNDPFRSWARGGGEGFKAIAPASGTIISFATSEGSTASDGKGNNGLFTEQLAREMRHPQPIESVFKKTRVKVEELSNGSQSPQEWSKLKGDFYFRK